MTSLLNFCLLLVPFVCTGNCSERIDTLTKKYIPLISDVHKYYGTSSVFFIFSRNDRRLQELTSLNFVCREFSRNGVFTLTTNFDNLETGTNLYRQRIVRPLIVVILKSIKDIAEFTENAEAANKAYPIWLVIFVDELNARLCEYCNRPVENIFNLRFDTEMVVVCCRNPVLKEWWSIHRNRTETADFAVWTKHDRLTLLAIKGLYARRHNIHGEGLRVAIVTKSTLVYDYGDEVGGFGGAVLQELQDAMNFTIAEIHREVQYGSWSTTTKSWSGVVGQVARRKADLGVAEFTITNSRVDVVDFTLPLMISRTRLYIKIPDGSDIHWCSYIEVFRFDIWMTLIVLLIASPILLTVIKVKRGSVPSSCLIGESFLHVWGIFCQEAISQFPAETPLRIAYVSIFVSAVVVSAAYSASLISFLTVSSISLPFSTLDGFANDKSYKLIVIQNSSNYDLFASSNEPVLKKMMASMKPWKELPQTLKEGFEQVCHEKVAFFTDEVVKKTMTQYINCKLAEIESGRADNLALILSPNSQYTGVINYHIQRFRDNGMLNYMKHKYLLKGSAAETTHSVVSIWGIVPLLSVLVGGLILAFVLLFCEKMYHSKKINVQESPRRINETRARVILSSRAPQ